MHVLNIDHKEEKNKSITANTSMTSRRPQKAAVVDPADMISPQNWANLIGGDGRNLHRIRDKSDRGDVTEKGVDGEGEREREKREGALEDRGSRR